MKRFFLSLILVIISIWFYSAALSAGEISQTRFIPENLDTSTYYYCRLNDTSYYLKFEKICPEKAEGVFFVLDGSVTVRPENFYITKKRKNYIVQFAGESKKIRAEISVKENGFTLKYATISKILGIFNKLNWSEELFFKKYNKPPFVKYPQRYKTGIFDKIVVKNDVVYGNAEGYWDSYPSETESYIEILTKGILSTVSKKNLNLKIDIYYPEADSLEKRPLILFIHGGGFYIGDKKSEAMVEWCRYFAGMGYVTASVNYRLGFKPLGPSVERAGYRALQDVHSAMRFLVKNADRYGIDPDYLFAAGSSAGGVTSLNLAFMRNKNRPESTGSSLLYNDLGDIESSSNNISQKFQLRAIANMWGAVNDLALLNNAKTSVISFHGDADKIVPIDYDFPFQDMKSGFSSLVLKKMYGSLPIHIKLKELGIREELHIFESAGHSPHVDIDNHLNENFNFISKKIRDFFYEEFFPEDCKIKPVPAMPDKRAMPVYETEYKKYVKIFWEIEGGIITGTKNNQVRVVWFGNAKTHKLKLSVLSESGAGFYDEYEF